MKKPRSRFRPRFEIILPKEYLLEIGHVVVLWAYLESEFDNCIHHFFRLHPEVRKLTSVVPKEFNKRVALFKDSARIAFIQHPATMAYCLQLADRAAKLRDDRDYFAHGQWVPHIKHVGKPRKPLNTGNFVARRIKNADWSKVKSRPFSLNRLRKTHNEIGDLAADFIALPRPNAHWYLKPEITAGILEFRRRNYPNIPTLKKV